MISPSNYRNWLFILCFWPLTRLNCWAYTYCIKKSTSLVTSLTIFLIGWVSRFYVLQRISPWALPLLLQSVVFDFLSNTPGGAVACASTVLNAFRDFNTEDLSNKTPLLNCIYSTMGFEGMYGYFWCLQFNNSYQYLSSSSTVLQVWWVYRHSICRNWFIPLQHTFFKKGPIEASKSDWAKIRQVFWSKAGAVLPGIIKQITELMKTNRTSCYSVYSVFKTSYM